MAKAKAGKGLGTTRTVLIGVGILLLGFGTYWYLNKRKRIKKKKECEDKGGTWDEKTNSCILPENREQRILKDVYDNLTFESGKAIIKTTSFPYLDELVTVVQDPDALTWKLEIQGHTDNVGGANYNQKLSEDRANAVKKYLVDKGVSSARITAKGFGMTKPIATNDTPEGRSKNRRVEFLITKPTVQNPTTDQQKQWLEQQAKDISSITDKSRFEPFTKIPNYTEGYLSTRNYEKDYLEKLKYDPNLNEILKYIPNGNFLVWINDKNLVSWRDDKIGDLKIYLENGNIISKTPNNISPRVWKYLGTWK